MIFYYTLLTILAVRSMILLYRGQLVTDLGINLSSSSYDSGAESAPFMVTLNAAKDALEAGDGSDNIKIPVPFYEEGTFTPIYTTSGTGFDTITMNVADGWYAKLGNLVHIELTMRTGDLTKGSASGNVSVSGLPFSALNNSATIPLNSVGRFGEFVTDPIVGYANGDIIVLLKTQVDNLTVDDMNYTSGNNNYIKLGGTYLI